MHAADWGDYGYADILHSGDLVPMHAADWGDYGYADILRSGDQVCMHAADWGDHSYGDTLHSGINKQQNTPGCLVAGHDVYHRQFRWHLFRQDRIGSRTQPSI